MALRKAVRRLLVSAARTADTTTPLQNDHYHGFVRLYLTVTVASGSGSLTPVIRGYDQKGANAVQLSTGGAPVTQTGTYVYELGPPPVGEAFGNIREVQARRLPDEWDVLVKHADASSYTYTLVAELTEE